ncbi:hypothetical protein HBA54_08345 [Pelagibius litoralis]|uniref:Uncharacterized protein n=1 Tax=Pelagibius litoralis TaxID=374515 RepID=A0A967EVX2_9PROT|nr:hypothetical protein [Pelagibius litoralis]NIA68599.1 hypothetical protein [Pelagibius litoralis]
MPALSPSEIARYNRDGLLIPDYRIPAARLVELRAALDEMLANNPE